MNSLFFFNAPQQVDEDDSDIVGDVDDRIIAGESVGMVREDLSVNSSSSSSSSSDTGDILISGGGGGGGDLNAVLGQTDAH